MREIWIKFGSFPLTVTVTTMGYRSYKNPLNKDPLRTVTGRGNDPRLNEKKMGGQQELKASSLHSERMGLQPLQLLAISISESFSPPFQRARGKETALHATETGPDFIWGFPKIRDTILGIPIMRTIVFWGLYWGSLILRNYHFSAIKDDEQGVGLGS